jgi:ABC-type cobalt transport system substrate-binding protein
MITPSNLALLLVLTIVATAVITAIFIRPEWFGLEDGEEENNGQDND